MPNENMTVAQVCEKIASVAKEMHESDYGEVWSMAFEVERCNEAVLDAHNRELSKKDAEIESLKAENAHLRVIICGATYADCYLRDENVRLRALVKELADSLCAVVPEHADCKDTKALCEGGCMPNGICRQETIRALVAKAREVVHE